MLATSAEPFDDPNYLFEVKWDGVRGLVRVEKDGIRVWGRENDYTGRYPELDELRQLPPGTVLDGELVMLKDGLPDFHALMARHSRRNLRRPFYAEPIRYVAFDLLSLGKRCLVNVPFSERRDLLHGLLPDSEIVVPCEGVVGKGKAFFKRAIDAGHEGIVAKRLNSKYAPDKRNGAWKKCKQKMLVACAVFGYRVGPDGVKDVLLATMMDGKLGYVGTVELGITGEAVERLESLRCAKPALPCTLTARWVKPDLLCVVQHCGWRPGGWWRDACVVAWGE